MPMIRAVLGDIDAVSLGVCYPHEHLLGRPPGHLAEPDFMLDSEEAAIREMNWFREAGGRSLVEMSTPDYGRDAAGLRRVSQASGVQIICATGYNKEKLSKPFLENASVAELTHRCIQEVNQGIDSTGIRAGVIKASSSLNQISPLEEKMFIAAARAHRATGAPISTHTEAGTMALEQVALLASQGVNPGHVIIGHVDRKLDWEYHLELARTGVYIGFDQLSKEKYYPDSLRISFIKRLVEAGFGKQILISGDQARRSYLPGYETGGGPGFTYILWRFVPWMREAGVPQSAIEDILIHNPARALSFCRV